MKQGVSCESYCTGFSGCEYITVKHYRDYDENYDDVDLQCNADKSPTNKDTLYYWTQILVIDYCYTNVDNDDYEDDEDEGYWKLSVKDGSVMQTFYSDSTCDTQQGNAVSYGTVGNNCEVDDDGDVNARFIAYGTASDDNLEAEDLGINGQACVATGDPHFITFNGNYHHFQGQNDKQYYYIAPCKGWTNSELPFTILATHSEWTTGSTVMGVEDLVFELYDNDGTQYLLFISPSHNGYIQGTTFGTKYDDNVGQSGYSEISDGDEIGDRFTFSRDDDLYTITIAGDTDCDVTFKFEGRTVTILPPTCYTDYICGLCGDFKSADGILRGCNNEPVQIEQDDEDFWQNPLAFDVAGNGWEIEYFQDNCATTRRRRLQVETDLVYTPTLPDNFNFTNPCDSTIQALTIKSCQTARDNAAECCDKLGSDVCDSIQEDCSFDACVSAGNNASAIDEFVKELFTDAVDSVCTIPGIESIMSEDNLVPNQDEDGNSGANLLDNCITYAIVAALVLCY